MVWPILISVSVTPGALAARAGQSPEARYAAEAALDCKNKRRDTMASSFCYLVKYDAIQ
jgi:hypothetical protein